MSGEKRKYMRFNVLMDAVSRTSGAVRKLKINNFSREGVGLISRAALNEGEEVAIEMMIPGDNVPVVLSGRIAWATGPVSDDSQHRGGLKFDNVSNHDRSRILEYIYQKWIMPDKNGIRQYETEEK